ncbi:Predicted ester cyclase [Bradyrhizobium lablabi]|uniref:Predicted ester cyclase n=1 Tax=Bradyrhizobium lablabi TaxID=722472 RepID=A0A1M6XVI7_9BRAD|nr:ester cyclase [Bradyrhizobium lablabi]SHL09878.1 Predicted ester cyclase [Bradyrhizobium lablabi]
MSDKPKHARTKHNRISLQLAHGILLVAALTFSLSAPALAADGVKIDDLVVALSIPDAQREATLKAVRAFYDFWNTGDEALLKEAIAPNFTDHTLPPGRPQGPEGPAFASRRFRAAVPDLKVAVAKMIVAGNYITVHMNFTGHFTGRFGQTQGKGQPVPFIATDLVKIENGRITDNWHIEDNLTLLQEMGVAKVD